MTDSDLNPRRTWKPSTRQFSLRTLLIVLTLICVWMAYQKLESRRSPLLDNLSVGDAVHLDPIGAANRYAILVGHRSAEYTVDAIERDYVQLSHQKHNLLLPVASIHYIKHIKSTTTPSPRGNNVATNVR